MFYKEWLSVRPKFWMWLAFYGIGGFFFSLYASYINHGLSSPSTWTTVFSVLTLFNGFIGGFDVISEEKDKQTISFLLVRPVSRGQIYSAKLLTNIAALWLAGCLGSLIPFITIINNLRYEPLGETLTSLLAMAFALIVGTAIICLTALVSIYTHNATQTLLFSPIIFVVVYSIANQFYLILASRIALSYVTSIGFLACFTVSLYYAGLFCFKRKKF